MCVHRAYVFMYKASAPVSVCTHMCLCMCVHTCSCMCLCARSGEGFGVCRESNVVRCHRLCAVLHLTFPAPAKARLVPVVFPDVVFPDVVFPGEGSRPAIAWRRHLQALCEAAELRAGRGGA